MRLICLEKPLCFVLGMLLATALARSAGAFPTSGDGHANCLSCHSSSRTNAADVPTAFTARPGESIDLSVNVTNGSEKYSISLAGLDAPGLSGFTPDSSWVNHFSTGSFNADPQYGGPFYALSNNGVNWSSPVEKTFTLQLADTTAIGTYDLTFTIAGKGGGRWRDVEAFQLNVLAAPGDFDSDGDRDGADIDALVMEIVGGSNASQYDLTGEGTVDNNDLAQWLAVAGAANLASGNPYLLGDANLDGSVDASDFDAWFESRFSDIARWTLGDFNADGGIDVRDFNIWNSNKSSSSSNVAVPEPAASVLLLIMAIPVGRRFRLSNNR
ncbi:MAG: hypothetical protein KDA60_16290 [Planctomycetales bacterium]|nr:hypothetical protein [Planctomycetales bacterium]